MRSDETIERVAAAMAPLVDDLLARKAEERAAAKRVGGGTSPSVPVVGQPAGDLERGDAA